MPDEHGIVDLSIDPPEVVVLDTSAVCRVLFEDGAGHVDYREFLARAVGAGTTLAYCEMLDLELAQACVKAARRQHHGDRSRSVVAGRDLIREVFGRWRAIIGETDSRRVPIGPLERHDAVGSPVRDAAFHLIERYGLDSYDATHAATAILLGAPLLCADRGFAQVPEELLTLITDRSGARSFRRVREARRE